MSNVARVSLPDGTGSYYNALTDTNLDHFSLYSDVDNILIKRKSTGSGTISASAGPLVTVTVAHNLGYVPFFSVYVNFIDIMGDNWKVLNNQFDGLSVPHMICAADTTNLYIGNFDASSHSYAYDIFYDDMSQTGSPTITESTEVFKIARPTKTATSLNPNDYIMHSDLNNLKILKQTTTTVSVISGNTNVAHGATITTPYKFFCFVKFPDGKVALSGNAAVYSYDESKWIQTSIDGTNIVLRASGSFNVDITYIIYGTGTSGVDNTGHILAVAASGFNALTDTNPEHYNFHSKYNTLKYNTSGVWDMGSITAGTTKTIAHNLGYTPFFMVFAVDLVGTYSSGYAITPFYWGRSTIPSPTRDIAEFAYADSTNLYLKAYYQTNAAGTSSHPNFYYKLFKNNLGL